jgi:hypothetical protein
MTHDKNCEGFRLAEEGNIESRESAEVAIANEQNWRSYILEKNAIVEQLVQDNLESVDGVDSFTGLIGEYTTEDYVPDEIIKLFEKRGVPTDAFVRARCTTSQHDSSFKAPKNKGKAEKVIEYLQKKRDNPHIELTPEYDCWVLRAAECCRKPVILSETVEASEERTSSDAETEADEQPIAISNPIDIVGNSPLLLEASRCFVGCTMQTEVDAVVRKQIDVAMAKVKSRYEFFKNHDTPNTTELQYHWALGAFEENIHRCIEVLGIANQINPRVETATSHDSLLSPQSTPDSFPFVLEDENLKDMTGVSLYYDPNRSAYCHVMCPSLTNKSFTKQYDADRRASKTPSTEFSCLYPATEPKHSAPGSWHGLFTDLSLLNGFSINPNATDCLTRTNGTGLFIWSERTIKKLEDTNMSGASLQDKQIQFVLCMFKLIYELMMNKRDCVHSGPFKPFMSKVMGLRNGTDDDK